MAGEDVIRDPDKVQLTIHSKQQMKDRNIGVYEIKKAIREGTVEPGAKETDIKYRLEFPGPDLLVIVDSRNGNIATVYYDDSQGAQKGGI